MKEINLVIAAMDEEVDALLKNLESFKEVDLLNDKAYEFSIEEEDYLLCKGKIGKVATSLFLGQITSIMKIKRIFNIGTSGGLDPSMELNEIVIATKVGYHDADVVGFGYEYGQIPGCPRYFECDNEFIEKKLSKKTNLSIKRGIILSGDTFVTKKNFKNILSHMDERALCVEMEAAAVGQCAYMLNIPFVVVRSISDIVTKENNSETMDNNLSASTTNSALGFLYLVK